MLQHWLPTLERAGLGNTWIRDAKNALAKRRTAAAVVVDGDAASEDRVYDDEAAPEDGPIAVDELDDSVYLQD